MRKPSRRAFLAATGAAGLGASAGCLGFLETERASREPPLPENRPDSAYIPSHVEGMEMAGMETRGRYACALTYTFPHRFWLVRDADTDRVDVRGEDDVHLMVAVWDAETGVALPTASPEIEYTDPDDERSTLSPWQMLSQRMGVHHGDNVSLGPEGNYDVTVRLVPPSTRRASGESVEVDPVEFEFSFTFDRSSLDDLPFEDIPADREGTEGAVDPMDMESARLSQAPPEDSFPISVLGSDETGGAELVVGTASEFGDLTGDGETYVAASLRTPHNRFVLPDASLSATADAGGEQVLDGDLVPTLDSDLGYHYGAVVPSESEIEGVTASVDTPPQVSRHEGYETAFFEFSDVSV